MSLLALTAVTTGTMLFFVVNPKKYATVVGGDVNGNVSIERSDVKTAVADDEIKVTSEKVTAAQPLSMRKEVAQKEVLPVLPGNGEDEIDTNLGTPSPKRTFDS
jgi:hypothetical protein